MQIQFDRSIKIAGIGLVPWTRLGLEKWLPIYAIASLSGWGVTNPIPPVYALDDYTAEPVHLDRQNSQQLINQPAFQAMLADKLPGYDLLTYKPVKLPAALAGRRLLASRQGSARTLENKIKFRQQFPTGLQFAPYRVIDLPTPATAAAVYAELCQQLQTTALVVQDATLSGGKGTFRVHQAADFTAAIGRLQTIATTPQLLVSAFLDNVQERSLQVCVTDQAIYTGPLQTQVVANQLLAHATLGLQFCGAVIDQRQQVPAQLAQANSYAQIVGQKLQAMGYRGIFGIDLLVNAAGQVYMVEANVRITGVTPLLTAFYTNDQQVPFYLLHCLALGGYDYEITDETQSAAAYPDSSLLILHNKSDAPCQFDNYFAPGIYTSTTTGLDYQPAPFAVTDLAPNQYYIAPYFNQTAVAPGERLAMIYANRSVLAADGAIDADTRQAIEKIYKRL